MYASVHECECLSDHMSESMRVYVGVLASECKLRCECECPSDYDYECV